MQAIRSSIQYNVHVRPIHINVLFYLSIKLDFCCCWHSVWNMITLQISQLINYQHKTVFRNGDNYLEMWYAQRHLHASGIHWMGFYFVIWSQHCISLRDHTVGTCLMVASVSEFHTIKSFCFGKYFISYEMGRCVLKVMTTSTSSVQLISSNLRI